MAKRRPSFRPDKTLQEALRKAYTERAKRFIVGIRERGVEDQMAFLRGPDFSALLWNLPDLGISPKAFEKVVNVGVPAHMVFCHPDILQSNSSTLKYYRNLAALSAKGLGQMAQGLRGAERTREYARVVNAIISSLVEDMKPFALALAQAVIPLEIGAELQGTWVNLIGQGAARQVKKMITDFVDSKSLASKKENVQVQGKKRKTETHIILKNRWTIVFGSEPDVAIRDPRNVLRGAIEIKGSMDRAGAQTRYGEAKKSFGKALAEYAQCETIYLASCFTDSVMEQVRQDAQVRKVFNLVDILANYRKRGEFLDEIFKHLIRII